MKKFKFILPLIFLCSPAFSADLKLLPSKNYTTSDDLKISTSQTYTVIKKVRNAKEALILFNNEKALANEKLKAYELDHQTFVRELENGYEVKFVFKKKGK